MKLTRFTDYSLRTLMYLASTPDRRATIAQVAQAFDISENHLIKVVHFLGRQGWVETVRGKGGGLHLAMAPETICLGKVVRDTEFVDAPAECFTDQDTCKLTPLCQLKHAMHHALSAFYEVLDGYTLADITSNRHELASVLRIHPA